MSPDAGDHRRPEIIRAVHGVTRDGHWFLLADLVGNRPGDSSPSDHAETRLRDEWLVVLGHRERDIINSRHPSA